MHSLRIFTYRCGVYMAPSTVGDHSNLGIYTAKAMKNGDKVPFPEIIIPMIWRTFNFHPTESFTDGTLWDRYIWEQVRITTPKVSFGIDE